MALLDSKNSALGRGQQLLPCLHGRQFMAMDYWIRRGTQHGKQQLFHLHFCLQLELLPNT